MKMLFTLVIGLLCLIGVNAQNVKERNHIYTVDEVAAMYSDYNGELNQKFNFTSMDKKTVYFTLMRRQAYRLVLDAKAYRYQAFKYFEIQFSGEKATYYTKRGVTHIITEIYRCKSILPDGTIDVSNLVKCSNDFDSKAPRNDLER